MVAQLVVVGQDVSDMRLWFSIGTMKGRVDGRVDVGVVITNELSVWIRNSIHDNTWGDAHGGGDDTGARRTSLLLFDKDREDHVTH